MKNRKVSNTEFFTNCTSTIVRQVNSIENLVSEFSNFARMPDRNLKLASLDNIILNQINTQKITHKNVEFKLQIKPKKININCDFNQINRLFMNIFEKFSRVNFKKRKKGKYNCLKKSNFFLVDIEDNGDGFPKNKKNFLSLILPINSMEQALDLPYVRKL